MKTLLLDKEYKPLRFINLRKLVLFLCNDKIDIVSNWDHFLWNDFKQPSIVRLKEYVRRHIPHPKFSRMSLFRRDENTCQYTGKKLPISQLSIDHVIPKSRGGETSWTNCVTAWNVINYDKGDRTPEECGLKLIKEPKPPNNLMYQIYLSLNEKHPDWALFFKGVD